MNHVRKKAKKAPLSKTNKWAEEAIELFDQKPLEVRAPLNLKVTCLF